MIEGGPAWVPLFAFALFPFYWYIQPAVHKILFPRIVIVFPATVGNG